MFFNEMCKVLTALRRQTTSAQAASLFNNRRFVRLTARCANAAKAN